MINFGYVAEQSTPSCIFTVRPLALSTPSVAIQPEVPRQMQIGPSLFWCSKILYSLIKGENWIALMLISDHD